MKGVAWWSRVMLAMLIAVSVAGCAKTQAKAKMPAPVMALEIPPPPARVAVPVQLPEPEPMPVAPPPAPAPPQRPRPDTPRTGSSPPTPPVAATSPVDPATAPVLQTSGDTAALEQKTQNLITEAQRNLDRVKYQDLGLQARAQYDNAVSFIKNARNALANRNYMYAEYLAAKAAAVARELVKS